MNVEHDMGEVRVRPWQESSLRFRWSRAGLAFLPSWYVVPDDVAPHFVVDDVLIEKTRQLCPGGGVPAGLFAESARGRFPGVSLAHDLLCEGAHLEVRVSNVTGVERCFRCGVVGRIVEPGQSCARGSHMVVGLETRATPTRECHEVVMGERVRLSMTPTYLYVPDGVLDDFMVDELFVLSGGIYSRVPREMLSHKSLRKHAEITLIPDRIVLAGSLLKLLARPVIPSYFRGAVLGAIGEVA